MNKLRRILDLISQTGDRYIFEDEQGNGFVVMRIDEYEKIIQKKLPVEDLEEQNFANKINQDMADWQVNDAEVDLGNNIYEPNEPSLKVEVESEEDQYYFEPVQDEE